MANGENVHNMLSGCHSVQQCTWDSLPSPIWLYVTSWLHLTSPLQSAVCGDERSVNQKVFAHRHVNISIADLFTRTVIYSFSSICCEHVETHSTVTEFEENIYQLLYWLYKSHPWANWASGVTDVQTHTNTFDQESYWNRQQCNVWCRIHRMSWPNYAYRTGQG